MEVFEGAAEAADEGASAALVQPEQSTQRFLRRAIVRAAPDEGARQVILSLFNGRGKQLKSAMLTSVASPIASDPFAKIKSFIHELIEQLLQESADAANQKGWCDNALADAKPKRDSAATQVEELNGNMARYEAGATNSLRALLCCS